jgi:signal transduction histidine kinase
MTGPTVAIMTVAFPTEDDLLLARRRARQISQSLGFSPGDTTRIVTALSEITRNAFEYAGGGTVAFAIDNHSRDHQELVIRVSDRGPGIADVAAVLSSQFQSRTGMGVGVRGSRSLMDRFDISSVVGEGTTVTMSKRLPWSAPKFGTGDVIRLVDQIAKGDGGSALGEMQAQNQALLQTLEELTAKNVEVERLREVAIASQARAEAAQLVAEHSLAVRGRFMALTTHELRTPLNAIIGYLQLLDIELAGSLTEKQQGHFARTQKAANHLLRITNDFLEMAAGDAGKLQVAKHPGAARHVMSEATALVTPQAAARDITIHLSESVERAMYLGDSHRVRQILINLLGNAVTFTPRGQAIQMHAEEVADAPAGTELTGGPWCVIRVTDSGPGIPPEKLAFVFEPFVQLSENGQSTRKGSGLGLTVSRQLARLMGGDLTAESRDTGAEFTLWLPEGRGVHAQDPSEDRDISVAFG